jgi:hypothetical protein
MVTYVHLPFVCLPLCLNVWCRPEQSSSVESSPGQGTQGREGSAAEGGSDGDSKLTQETGFFAGNPRCVDHACSRQ